MKKRVWRFILSDCTNVFVGVDKEENNSRIQKDSSITVYKQTALVISSQKGK